MCAVVPEPFVGSLTVASWRNSQLLLTMGWLLATPGAAFTLGGGSAQRYPLSSRDVAAGGGLCDTNLTYLSRRLAEQFVLQPRTLAQWVCGIAQI